MSLNEFQPTTKQITTSQTTYVCSICANTDINIDVIHRGADGVNVTMLRCFFCGNTQSDADFTGINFGDATKNNNGVIT